ncbi:MAG: CRISPR system precrRNA processing endoribonuclease RAMP protein Cas6 [Methanotrichaceae archaeon]|nr:CRISPR system precrRNA processing endoribonuclease RAMP protein Cas6 [Methanotrichaceae archaeon]
MGDLTLSQFEARIRFDSDADLSYWSGNTLRSGFGAHLRALVCTIRGTESGPCSESDSPEKSSESCSDCSLRSVCVYDYFFNSSPSPGAKVLRKQSDIPRPFVFDPPAPGRHSAGSEAVFNFTLIGKGVEFLPYFLLALRNLGESGMSRGYRLGYGRFALQAVDSIGYGMRNNIFCGDTVYNRAVTIRFQETLNACTEHRGDLTVRFLTPAQIKEGDRFTATPTFRGLISRLLFRANALAEFFGSGMLYDHEKALALLGECREVSAVSASTKDVRAQRYFHKQKIKKQQLPPFFKGEIKYYGEFSRDVMALLELGRLIHVGKMATFGNGLYEIEI